MNNAIKVVNTNSPRLEYVTNINKSPWGEYISVSIQHNRPFCMSRSHMNTILANTTTWAFKLKPISHNATRTHPTNFPSTK